MVFYKELLIKISIAGILSEGLSETVHMHRLVSNCCCRLSDVLNVCIYIIKMFVFSITILHVYYTVSAMYMYKCCILMGFIAYWNFQINHLRCISFFLKYMN